jgi:plastocyanin
VVRIVIATALAFAVWPASGADSHPGHGPVVVAIGDLAYAPAQVRILVGDYVLWNWAGPDTNHSVTADAGQAVSFDSDPGKDSGQIPHAVNDGYSIQVNQEGTFTYHCKVHSFMKGTIVVGPAPPGSAPQPLVKPTLSGVRVTRVSPCRRQPCSRTGVLVRFTVNEAVSMRATLRRVRSGHPSGPIVKEIDFSGPPGTHSRRLDLGRLKPGRYQLRLVAVDQSTGAATKAIVAPVVVRR